MSVRLYVDVHVHVRAEIVAALLAREVDVLTAQQDGASRLDDRDLLVRATTIGRALFSQDSDLLVEAVAMQRQGRHFAGVIYAHQLGIIIRQAIEDLELIAKAMEPAELASQIIHLPLK